MWATLYVSSCCTMGVRRVAIVPAFWYNLSRGIDMSRINMRIDNTLKQETEHIFDSLGLNMSTAIHIFLKQVVKEKGIPFPLTTRTVYDYNQETRQALADAENGKNLNGPFESVQALMEDLNA